MNPTVLVAVIAALAVFLLMRRAGKISTPKALEALKNGAVVIDVRTRPEFAAGHLKRAINLPLDEIETMIGERVKVRNKTLLLHCQSGMRSGVACKKLKAMGYTNVFNLGSYARAAEIVEEKIATLS